MIAVLLSLGTFLSTLFGGLFSIKNKENLHKIMGFTAGVLVGVVFFDIFPEIIELIKDNGFNSTGVMVALVAGFLVFHVLEKSILIHHSHEDEYAEHKHPQVGILSGLALAGLLQAAHTRTREAAYVLARLYSVPHFFLQKLMF